MAFFDDIGKKLSQVGQTAVQKTREMTEIAKFNNLVSEEEKKINNNYYQIGKLYADIHQNDSEGEFKEMLNAIKESQVLIFEYKKKIQELKGLVCCQKCGQYNPKDSSFCSSCGLPLPKQENEDANRIKCIGCGEFVDKTMSFCTSCGKSVSESLKAAAHESPAHGVCPGCGKEVEAQSSFCIHCGMAMENPAPVQEEVRKCEGCGAKIEEGSKFCIGCGTKIE